MKPGRAGQLPDEPGDAQRAQPLGASPPVRNMVFAIVGNRVVVCHTKNPPSDEEWDLYLEDSRPYFARGMSMRYLVVTEGGAPTAVQRMRMNEMLAEWTRANPNVIRTAIITRSAFVRGVVTALNWFRPIARAFAPEHLNDALAFLEIAPKHLPDVQNLITSLKAQLYPPPVESTKQEKPDTP